MKVLVVEDDAATAALLTATLREAGDVVVLETNGTAALATALEHHFDAIVLEIAIPGMDGLSIVHRLRRQNCHTPVLILSGRHSNRDVIHGLNAGADDYLTKPFDLEVFLARLRAVARRGTAPLTLLLSAGNLVLNTATREVQRGTRTLNLTRTEYSLLELLVRNAGRVVPREQIVETVWGFDSQIENATLDTFVHLLRRKVEPPGEEKLIQTIRGVGYSLRAKTRTRSGPSSRSATPVQTPA